MSKLDELIQGYCPNGVPYVELGTVVNFLNGRAYKQSELLDSGKYKVLRVGNFHTNDKWYYSDLELDQDKYCEDGDLLYTWAATLGPEIWSGEKVIFHYHIWKLVFDEKVLNKRFLFHFLKMDIDTISKSLTNSTMPHVSMASMKKRIVPVPPLEVQREIVRVLDSFTLLTAELTAELTARKSQYEFYRRKLLTFDESIPQLQLRDVASFRNGKGHEKNIADNGKYVVVNSKFISTNGQVIKNSDEQLSPLYFDDIAMVMSDLPNGRALAKCYLIDKDDKFTLNQRIGGFHTLDENIVVTKYLFYILDRNWQLLKYDNGVDQTNLKKDDILNISIPVPAIDVQKRLVYMLDNFDAICSDLNIGLPAEIEARQKQYEYYRDVLLTYAATGKIIAQTDRQTDRQTDKHN